MIMKSDRALKRSVDFTLALGGIFLISPLWMLAALLIKLEDRGPIFFHQERWGEKKKKIRVMKFRTMTVHDGQNGGRALQAKKGDGRITRVGYFLRATALDELPQLINIVKGDMSFVGPRSLPINELQIAEHESTRNLSDEMIPGFEARAGIKPGLTGIAQIFAPRDVPRKHKFRYDRLYAKKANLWLDIRLILLSVWISVSGRWGKQGERNRIKIS